MPVAGGIHYEWHGDEGAPPLILSSGLGGLASYWEPNLLALADDYRVLVYDHRGTGQSERKVLGAMTVEAMAQDVADLLDELALDEPPAFVGHALGGLIGLALAIAQPGRLQRLMVVNGWASLDPHTARCFDTRLALLRDSGPRAYLHAQPLFLFPPAYISRNDAALLRAEVEQIEHFPGQETVERRIHAVRTFDPGPGLGAINIPVMCLAADDDMLVPAAASELLADAIPGAKLASMTWGGHACNVTRPDDFNARVADWLR
ncbi:pyrimidine utilization protein D [Sphingomonas sp.]|uniref:pyrimidine utilization protein D n=1 Tax=Sphingomonas sp. TaxID=28214 RepID=UPI002DD6664A|nr:pyrimidine utilization protein D [Sphingomonas sp.]